MSLPALKQPKADATDETKPGQRLPVLPATSMALVEFRRQTHFCKVPTGATKEDLLREDFWKLVSEKLNRHDVIIVLGDDESWEAELRVEHSHGAGAQVSVVKVIKRKSFADGATLLGDGQFVTAYKDGGWCVLRTQDQYAVLTGYATEGAVMLKWLSEQPRKVS